MRKLRVEFVGFHRREVETERRRDSSEGPRTRNGDCCCSCDRYEPWLGNLVCRDCCWLCSSQGSCGGVVVMSLSVVFIGGQGVCAAVGEV